MRTPSANWRRCTRKRAKRATDHWPLPLELQSRFPCRIGQGLDPSVVKISAAIEDHLLDALLLGALGDQLAYIFRRTHVAAGRTIFALADFLYRGGRDQGHSLRVIDDLSVNVVHRTIDVQPRTLRRAQDLLADSGVDFLDRKSTRL